MKDVNITENIIYIGAYDKDLDLFENQYKVPNGMAYNSYLIKDEKNVIIDTIDKRKTEEWLKNVENGLNGEEPYYLLVSHLEPDHAYNIERIARKYPKMKIIGNNTTFNFIPKFFDIPNLEERKVVVQDGDEVHLGNHILKFFMAPMVHWPEVMFTYEKNEKILFAADGFGKFGTLDTEEDWEAEARRYYFNIVGKYGTQVQNILQKASTLEIKMICSLHGPILKENLEYYIKKYDVWSSYKAESNGVFIPYASIYGNTENAAKVLKDILLEKGAEDVVLFDLARQDMAEAVANAFYFNKMIVAASSYNAKVFPPMEHFLNEIKGRNYQNRKVGIVQNGTWAPSAGKFMENSLKEMKNVEICKTMVTIESKLKENSKIQLANLADEILKNS